VCRRLSPNSSSAGFALSVDLPVHSVTRGGSSNSLAMWREGSIGSLGRSQKPGEREII
jgi:hypothetical protein